MHILCMLLYYEEQQEPCGAPEQQRPCWVSEEPVGPLRDPTGSIVAIYGLRRLAKAVCKRDLTICR